MRIWIARHGESEGNLAGTLQGCRIDTPLTANGRRQAEAMAIALAGAQVDAVVASPLQRARETAGTVAAPHGLGLSLDLELVEYDWGQWTGLSLDEEMERRVTQLRARWRSGDVDARPPEGESPVRAARRLRRVLDRVVASGARAPLLVGHGRSNRILLCVLLGRDLSRMDEVRQRNASVSLLEWDGEGPAVPLVLDDVGHLGSLPTSPGILDAVR